MIDSGMPALPASLTGMEGVPMVPDAGRRKLFLPVDGIGRPVLIGASMILLLPALLLLIVVALLVPWCLRVPVCGNSLPSIRRSSTR